MIYLQRVVYVPTKSSLIHIYITSCAISSPHKEELLYVAFFQHKLTMDKKDPLYTKLLVAFLEDYLKPK